MEYIILKIKKDSTLCCEHTENSTMDVLGAFLEDGVGLDVSLYLNWLSSKIPQCENNQCILEKKDTTILINDIFHLDKPDPDKYIFSTGIEEFRTLLLDYEKVYKLKPNFIVVTKDKGKFKVEGKLQLHDIEFLKIKFDKNKYIIVDSTETSIRYLGSFLITDFFTRDKEKYYQWISEVKVREIIGESCYLFHSSHEIQIGEVKNLFINYNCYRFVYNFYIKKKLLFEILNKIEELYKLKVNEITITYQNDKYIIEAESKCIYESK